MGHDVLLARLGPEQLYVFMLLVAMLFVLIEEAVDGVHEGGDREFEGIPAVELDIKGTGMEHENGVLSDVKFGQVVSVVAKSIEDDFVEVFDPSGDSEVEFKAFNGPVYVPQKFIFIKRSMGNVFIGASEVYAQSIKQVGCQVHARNPVDVYVFHIDKSPCDKQV